MLLSNFVYYVFLLLCMFRSRYCVSLCCPVYSLCVNVHCTTATGCQTKIYHIIPRARDFSRFYKFENGSGAH